MATLDAPVKPAQTKIAPPKKKLKRVDETPGYSPGAIPATAKKLFSIKCQRGRMATSPLLIFSKTLFLTSFIHIF